MQQDQVTVNRAGKYVKQLAGYRAFILNPLPPDPPLALDDELLTLLSVADQSVGRLDSVADMLPNSDLFVSMYVRKEAVLSSQIEGTQATLVDVLEYEANFGHSQPILDVLETINYVNALNAGLDRLEELPICNRLFREIHGILMQGVRGQEKSPGYFRETQNWIGPPGCTLDNATYVPPPPHEMTVAMGELEDFLNAQSPMPILIKCGLAHGQFEMIHPFLDGNGRLGRLLITFLLCEKRVLARPLLYLSSYFRQHQAEYYDRLLAISNDGDWEGWLKYFLKGIGEVSKEATDTARKIITMREEHRQLVSERVRGSYGPALLDSLYESPAVTSPRIRDTFGVSYVTANNLVHDFVNVGILEETTRRPRNKVYIYKPYLEILNRES
ncbi:MAG: Fic family protein [Chloroflexi bacterium]|nr:Fic family protein [Chloroflexota bacterium]